MRSPRRRPRHRPLRPPCPPPRHRVLSAQPVDTGWLAQGHRLGSNGEGQRKNRMGSGLGSEVGGGCGGRVVED